MKNKHLKLLFTFLAIVFLTQCSKDTPDTAGLNEQQRKKIESSVINRFNAMIKYAEAGELENILIHFDSAGPGSYIDQGTRYATFQDLVDNYRATWKIRNQDFGIPDTRLSILSPQFVSVSSTSVIQTTTTEGINFLPRQWSISTIWILKDGQWQIHSFHQFSGEAIPEEAKVPE